MVTGPKRNEKAEKAPVDVASHFPLDLVGPGSGCLIGSPYNALQLVTIL